MADPSSKKLLLLISSLSLLLASAAPRDPAIGVTYRPSISGLPAHERVVVALRSAGATHVLLPDPDPATLRAFLYSGISLLLSLPNSLLPALASNRSTARRWLSEHVLPFHPRARVAAISAGHAVLSSSPGLASSLLPAIQNLRSACLHLGLREISISTTHSFEILHPALPPSAARFRESLAEPYVRPLLDFLSATGSPFLIDLHPYELYRTDPAIPIEYALFEQAAFGFREDPGSHLRYTSSLSTLAPASPPSQPATPFSPPPPPPPPVSPLPYCRHRRRSHCRRCLNPRRSLHPRTARSLPRAPPSAPSPPKPSPLSRPSAASAPAPMAPSGLSRRAASGFVTDSR